VTHHVSFEQGRFFISNVLRVGVYTFLDILVQVMNEYDEQSDIAEDLRIKVSDYDPSKCWSSPLP
jgi:hypothetical protein